MMTLKFHVVKYTFKTFKNVSNFQNVLHDPNLSIKFIADNQRFVLYYFKLYGIK